MQVRIARQTTDLAPILAFYRDGLGLREIASFSDHEGYSGVMLELPGTEAHLEFTTATTEPGPLPRPHRETLLVLYLGSRSAVETVLRRLQAVPVRSANPYWDRIGSTVEDPDGFRVVLVAGRWGASDPVPQDTTETQASN